MHEPPVTRRWERVALAESRASAPGVPATDRLLTVRAPSPRVPGLCGCAFDDCRHPVAALPYLQVHAGYRSSGLPVLALQHLYTAGPTERPNQRPLPGAAIPPTVAAPPPTSASVPSLTRRQARQSAADPNLEAAVPLTRRCRPQPSWRACKPRWRRWSAPRSRPPTVD